MTKYAVTFTGQARFLNERPRYEQVNFPVRTIVDVPEPENVDLDEIVRLEAERIMDRDYHGWSLEYVNLLDEARITEVGEDTMMRLSGQPMLFPEA